MSLDIDELKKVLEQADIAYYEKDDPVISDSDYDKLTKLWQKLTGEKWMNLGKPSGQLTRIPHLYPMQSLEKNTSLEELLSWSKRANGTYICTPKIDGLSGELRYKNQKLYMGVSRGDGTVGEAILHSLGLAVRSGVVPAGISSVDSREIQIRGEIYLPKDKLAEVGGANCRNAAAGLVRKQSVDPRQVHLRFIAYRVMGVAWSYTEQLEWLKSQGFETPDYKVLKHIEFETLTEDKLHPDSWAPKLAYDIDGVVISHNDHEVRTALGATSKFPKWACAYKFESSEAETTLLAVEWNATRSGVVVPVYVFEAVQLAGTTVTRATGHNLGAYAKLGAKIGDTIVVTKSNDIIPEVVKVLK